MNDPIFLIEYDHFIQDIFSILIKLKFLKDFFSIWLRVQF